MSGCMFVYYGLVIALSVVFLGMVVLIVFMLIFSYKWAGEVLRCLDNCSAVVARAPLLSGGVIGRVLFVGGVSGIVTFPGFYLKRGGVDKDDLKSLPSAIKRRLAVIQWGLIVLLSLMMVLVGAAYWLRPYVEF